MMACQITGNNSADHSISSNNVTDIDKYSSQGCTQIELLFGLI